MTSRGVNPSWLEAMQRRRFPGQHADHRGSPPFSPLASSRSLGGRPVPQTGVFHHFPKASARFGPTTERHNSTATEPRGGRGPKSRTFCAYASRLRCSLARIARRYLGSQNAASTSAAKLSANSAAPPQRKNPETTHRRSWRTQQQPPTPPQPTEPT